MAIITRTHALDLVRNRMLTPVGLVIDAEQREYVIAHDERAIARGHYDRATVHFPSLPGDTERFGIPQYDE